jgi:hypothetical protein
LLTDSMIVSDILDNSNVLPRITMEITAKPDTLVSNSVAQLELIACAAAELAAALEIGVQKVDVSGVRAVTTGRRQVQDNTENTDRVNNNIFSIRRELAEADVTIAFDVVMTTVDPAATFAQLRDQLADGTSKLRKGGTLSSVDPANLSYGFTCPIGLHRPEVPSANIPTKFSTLLFRRMLTSSRRMSTSRSHRFVTGSTLYIFLSKAHAPSFSGRGGLPLLRRE